MEKSRLKLKGFDKEKFAFPIFGCFLFFLFILFFPIRAEGQSNSINYSIDEVSMNVNIAIDLSTQNEIIIKSQPSISTISWPIAKGASKIKVFADGKEQKYDLIKRGDYKIIIFNSGRLNQINFSSFLPPEKDGNDWEIFIPIIREIKIYIPDFNFTLSLPEGAKFSKNKIFLVHSLDKDSISQTVQANTFRAKMVIEPTSIVSFEGKTNYDFKASVFNDLINIINRNFLLFSLILTSAIIIVAFILVYFYLVGFKTKEKIIPPSGFLEKSYIYSKKITKESIAAVIFSWAQKNWVNIVEKEDNIFVLAQIKKNPPLPQEELILWQYLFKKGDLSLNLNKLEEKAQDTIIPKELIQIENSVINNLQQQEFIKNIASFLTIGLNNVLLIFSFIILITLSIASWLINSNWLVLPAIAFVLVITYFGERFSTLVILTNKGKGARNELNNWKSKLEFQIKKNNDFTTFNHNLPFMIFFSQDELIDHFSKIEPVGTYPFFISEDTISLPAQNIKKIVNFLFFISQSLNKLKEL